MSQNKMHSFQAPSQKYGILAAIAVFLTGSITQIFQEGLNTFRQLTFWYGLYGWLSMGIAIGYLVYLGFAIFSLLKSSSPYIESPKNSTSVDLDSPTYKSGETTGMDEDPSTSSNRGVAQSSDRASSSLGALPIADLTSTGSHHSYNEIPSRETEIVSDKKELTIPAGNLPDWEIAELPAPPSFTWGNILTTIGPGAILLGTSIGSSEWLLGPAITSRYGGFLLWLIPVSIILQAIVNTESIRYTMYTGEPIYTGFMRSAPGSLFWTIVYITLAFLQLIWPGWVSAAATALTAISIGGVPGSEHAYLIRIFGIAWFLLIDIVIIFGDKIERTLEKIQWFFVVVILLFLISIVSVYTEPQTYSKAIIGLTNFGVITPDLDWILICAFVSDAGAGGVINGAITNWYRDKGIGMGAVVGYIPALIGGRKFTLHKTGKVFVPTPESKKRWRGWWKFVDVDQYLVWAVGCFIGMILPALISLQFIPFGTEFVNQFGIAVYQAQYIVWATGNEFLWNTTLLVGFWILFSTQLGVTDAFVRMLTDIIWTGSNSDSDSQDDVRFIYYGILLAFSISGILILFLEVDPLFLILLGANIAGLNMAIISLHTLYVNRKFLPPELKPPLWREIVVVLSAIFYGFLFCKAAPGLFARLFSFI